MNPKQLWPAAVIAVLAITVLANVWLLYEAHDQDAAVVEPDYYRKAVAYDSVMAAQRASDSLGWHVEVALGQPDRARVMRLAVRLTDRDGAPVTGARVSARLLHNKMTGGEWSLPLTAADSLPGAYVADLEGARFGLWRVEVDAHRGTERFVSSLHCETGSRTVR